MIKKQKEHKVGDKFLIEDPAVRARVLDMTKRIAGLRDTITHLSETMGVLQHNLWDVIREAHPDLLGEWHVLLDHRTGELEIKNKR
jgi:hypothetical protein